MTTCWSCGGGLYQPSQGQSSCLTCNGMDQGPNLPWAATACLNCGAGQINAWQNKMYFGGPDQSYGCTNCIAGKYEFYDTRGICSICPSATFSLEGADACTPCPVGTYQNQKGSSQCMQCPEGTYQELQESDYCRSCNEVNNDKGTNMALGATRCDACGPGQISAYRNYNNFGGPLQKWGCTSCVAGKFESSSGECTSCSAGTYSSGGQTSCTLCPANSTSFSGSKDISNCFCNVGFYKKTTTTCSTCSDGTYADVSGLTSCKSCVAVCSLSNKWELTPCTSATARVCANCTNQCPAGYIPTTVCQANGAFSCVQCTAGTYASVPRSTSCVPCSSACVVGQTWERIQCTASMDRVCSTCTNACPVGWSPTSYCSSNGTFLCSVGCSAGQYMDPNTRACQQCPIGSWSDGSNVFATSCNMCADGYVTNDVGATSASQCIRFVL